MIKPRCKVLRIGATEPGSVKWRCRIRLVLGFLGGLTRRFRAVTIAKKRWQEGSARVGPGKVLRRGTRRTNALAWLR
jgi:hypothetical protein